MLSSESFDQLYPVDYSRKIGSGGFSTCYGCKTRPNIVVRISNLQQDGYFPMDLQLEEARVEFLNRIRIIFDEWSCLLVAQRTHAVRVEAFALKLVPHPSHRPEVCFESYIAMEALGEPLDKKYLNRNRAMDSDDLKHLTDQLLASLEFFEEVGVWHGDLKPHNIMTSTAKTYKLIDFGMAKFTPHFQSRSKPPGLTEIYTRPEYANLLHNYQIQKVPKTFCKKNDHFAVAMSLLQLGQNLQVEDLLHIRAVYDDNRSECEKKVSREIKAKIFSKLPVCDRVMLEALLQGQKTVREIREGWLSTKDRDLKHANSDDKLTSGSNSHFSSLRTASSLVNLNGIDTEKLTALEFSLKMNEGEKLPIEVAKLETSLNTALKCDQGMALGISNKLFCTSGTMDSSTTELLEKSSLFSRFPPVIAIDLDLSYTLTDVDASSLFRILFSVKNLRKITLNCSNSTSLTDVGFNNVMKGFDHCTDMQEAVLWFGGCIKLADDSMLALEKTFISKTRLALLELDCEAWNISNLSGIYLDRMLHKMNNLDQLSLNFLGCRRLSNDFAHKMPKTFNSMISLTTIDLLDFSDTKVTRELLVKIMDEVKGNPRFKRADIWGNDKCHLKYRKQGQ